MFPFKLLANECYFGNYYGGFRRETASFDPCDKERCGFDKEHKHEIGCTAGGEWSQCNIRKCGKCHLCACSRLINI